MTTRPSAVLFDAFGTLCKAPPVSELLPWHRMMPAKERRRIRDEWMRGRVGWPDLIAIGDPGRAPPEAVLEYQAAAITARTELFSNVRRILDVLKRRGVPMAVVSNLPAPYGPAVRRCLEDLMAGFAFSYEVGALKPERALFDAGLAMVGARAEQTLMVGDSPHADIDGAAALGMKTRLVDQRSESPPATKRLETVLDALA
ncbi:haloacid dehalogenase-like hydrolase family protein [Salinisphaera shabanensis T35B1]|jgi:HAD superfamily hydrolase (TIGR01509 family)|uniref:HAD family hydrolase n=1 Tax=Salinisphaera TaxID=180541 RepID=UPI00333FF6DE